MSILNFVKNEFCGWGKLERIFFPLEILLIICLSFYIGDDKLALVSAICGITYTIFAGKGKISCYIFGMIGTLIYAYLAFKNSLFGNLILYGCYYFPMEIIGILKWKRHLKKDTHVINKTQLDKNSKILYFGLAFASTLLVTIILKKIGGSAPFMDSFTTVFSIFGMLLTVKRCVEQWYIWLVVNALSTIMWIQAYINGSNCLATVIMWVTYFILAIYFLVEWQKELKKN